jgi:transcriptional regulator with XRE-family HTH domain
MTFADKLRELRERAGLTQAQLAEASGLPLGSLRNYEQGQREPYWSVLFKLAKALGVSSEAFAECAPSSEAAEETARPAVGAKRGRAGAGLPPAQEKPHARRARKPRGR